MRIKTVSATAKADCTNCGLPYSLCWAKQVGGQACCESCNHPDI